MKGIEEIKSTAKSVYLSAKAIKKVKAKAKASGRSFSYIVEQAITKL